MKLKLFLVLPLFVFQFGFSQARQYLSGVVTYDNRVLQNVDVINKTSEISTRTNYKGEFLIIANANDSILFYSKNFHLNKIKVAKSQLDQNYLKIVMIEKPEELDEVVIERIESFKIRGNKAYEQGKIDAYKTEKFDNNEGYQAMREGTFVNGLNFVEIGKRILSLFEKKSKNEELPKIEFSILAKEICEEKFFTQTLKLRPDEIDLFLQFCDSDPRSLELKKEVNVLKMMDFLLVKNTEFQKLKETIR